MKNYDYLLCIKKSSVYGAVQLKVTKTNDKETRAPFLISGYYYILLVVSVNASQLLCSLDYNCMYCIRK